MTTAMMIVAAVALPWLAGALLVSAMLARSGERDRWIAIGYGHFAGILVLMALLRGFDLAGLGLSFAPIAAVLALIAAAGAWMAWRRRPPPAADAHAPTGASGTALRVLAVVALALVAIRIGALAIEVVLRPLLPWDAWSQWATKAKVWSALRELAAWVTENSCWTCQPSRHPALRTRRSRNSPRRRRSRRPTARFPAFPADCPHWTDCHCPCLPTHEGGVT